MSASSVSRPFSVILMSEAGRKRAFLSVRKAVQEVDHSERETLKNEHGQCTRDLPAPWRNDGPDEGYEIKHDVQSLGCPQMKIGVREHDRCPGDISCEDAAKHLTAMKPKPVVMIRPRAGLVRENHRSGEIVDAANYHSAKQGVVSKRKCFVDCPDVSPPAGNVEQDKGSKKRRQQTDVDLRRLSWPSRMPRSDRADEPAENLNEDETEQ